VSKNKGKYHSKVGKDEAPAEQLQSLSSRALQFVRPHALKLGAVVAGVVVILVGFSAYSWWQNRRAAEATKIYVQAMDLLRAEIVAEDAPPPDPTRPPEGKDEPEKPKFKSARERSEAVLALLDRLDKEHGSTGVAAEGRVVKAGLLYDLGRHDEAIGAYNKFLGASGQDARLRFVAREGLGYALEAKALAQADAKAREAGLDEALRAFQQLQPDDKGYYRDYALFHQARIKATRGDKAGALALYRQILEKFAATPLKGEVETRIALLEEQG